MGWTQPSATTLVEPADTPRDDNLLLIGLLEPLRRPQERPQNVAARTSSSTLDSLASSLRSSSKDSTERLRRSVVKWFVDSDLTKDRTSTEDPEDHWPELLLGQQDDRRTSISMAKFASPAKQPRGFLKGIVFSTSAQEPGDHWPERLCGQRDDTPPEWTKSTLWISEKSRISSKASPTQESPRPQPLTRFDTLPKEELRDITFEILSGMLIALADSGNALLGWKALPFDPIDALTRCRQELERHRRTATRFIFASTDLVVLFQESLIDAGVARGKMAHIAHFLRRSHHQEIPERTNTSSFERDDEFCKLVKNAKNTLSAQIWDEFGFSVAQMAWHLVRESRNRTLFRRGLSISERIGLR